MYSINEIWQYIKSTQYNIKAEQVEPPYSTYTCKLYTTYVLICLNLQMFPRKKMQADFIEWNQMPLLNLYLSSDKQIWHISEICIICGFVEKTLQYIWMT